MATVFATAFHHVFVKAQAKKSLAHFSLDDFFHKVGVPWEMTPDNAKEFTGGKFKKK